MGEVAILDFGHHDTQFGTDEEILVEAINDLATGTRGEAFATLTNNYYSYDVTKLTTISKENNEKVYSMFFDEDYEKEYWLASVFIITQNASATFGIRYISGEDVGGSDLLATNGRAFRVSAYLSNIRFVQAVVTLSSDITFTGSSATGWSY